MTDRATRAGNRRVWRDDTTTERRLLIAALVLVVAWAICGFATEPNGSATWLLFAGFLAAWGAYSMHWRRVTGIGGLVTAAIIAIVVLRRLVIP